MINERQNAVNKGGQSKIDTRQPQVMVPAFTGAFDCR